MQDDNDTTRQPEPRSNSPRRSAERRPETTLNLTTTGKPLKTKKNGEPRKPYERTKPRETVGVKTHTKVVELAIKGNSYQDISNLTNVPITTVGNIVSAFNELLKEVGDIEAFRERRGQILDGIHGKLLKSLTEDKVIGEANLFQRAYASKQIYDQTRLEHNQSTSNAAHSVERLAPKDRTVVLPSRSPEAHREKPTEIEE